MATEPGTTSGLLPGRGELPGSRDWSGDEPGRNQAALPGTNQGALGAPRFPTEYPLVSRSYGSRTCWRQSLRWGGKRASAEPVTSTALRGLDAAVAVAGAAVVVGIVVPAVVLRDAVMVVMVASVVCRRSRGGAEGAEGENRDEQGKS